MTFSALSLVALPAAAGLARDVARVGERMGSGFLSVLSQIATPDADDSSHASAPAATQSAPADSPAQPNSSLSDKTKSWCQRFMGWLNQRHPTGDLDIQLSLDSLDQPHLTIDGQQSEAFNAAMAEDPTWLQEFRELSLDRMDEQGLALPGSSPRAAPALRIMQRDGGHQAAWST